MSYSTDDYLGLLTSEHRDKPLFVAAVSAFVEGFIAAGNTLLSLPPKFDLDLAEGAQLDDVGRWVGVSRRVAVPLTGIFFEWDGAAAVGWDGGYWQGPFDPTTGIVSVDDVTYRTMIRAKIAANTWNGTIEGLYIAWELVFGPDVIYIQDNQDMSMTVIYDADVLPAVLASLLTGGIITFKPSGVRVTYVPLTGSPLFAWDFSLPKLQGWTGSSVWAPGL